MTKIEELKSRLISTLVRVNAQSDRKNIEHYINKKMTTVLKDILPIAISRVRHTHFADDENVKLFASTRLRKSWGQIMLGGKQVDAPGLLTPLLFEVLETGYKKIGSAVRIKERTMDALMQYAIEENDDALWQRTFDFTDKDVVETAINVPSLRAYVKELEFDSTIAVAKRLRRLAIAKAILASLDSKSGPVLYGIQQPDISVLLQEAMFADSGRLYLKGLNLQNCPKDVRHAALGHCHLYDMRAGVFGVFAGLANAYSRKQQNIDAQFHHINDYLRNRDEVRTHITGKLWSVETAGFRTLSDYKGFHGYYKVKVALTSIGFGAKRNANASWKNQNGKWEATSLRSTFKSRELVDEFVQLDVVKQLLDEFQAVTNIVLLQLAEDASFASHFAVEGLKDSQKLAMVYQGIEAAILGGVVELVPQFGSEVLLPVHDGVYVTQPLDYYSMHYLLKVPFDIDKFYIQFDHTEIGTAMPDKFESDHRAFIAAETLRAQDYTPVYCSMDPIPVPKKQVVTPWGLIDADALPTEYWGGDGDGGGG